MQILEKLLQKVHPLWGFQAALGPLKALWPRDEAFPHLHHIVPIASRHHEALVFSEAVQGHEMKKIK
jgi:hypothetical protein